MQDSEPMLNARDIELVLKHIFYLQQRIDKAIEYIKRNYKVLLLSDPPKEAFNIVELLEILGDKE